MPSNCSLSDIFIQTLEQALDSVVVIDADNRVVLFNHAAETLWGCPRSEVLGQNVRTLVPDYLGPFHDGFIDTNRRTGHNRIVGNSRHIPIKQKNGASRWGSMSLCRVQSEGQILYTAFIKDVTEQHEEDEGHRLLSMVVDQTDTAILITDEKSRILYTNNGFTSMFDYNAKEASGTHPVSLLFPQWTQDAAQAIQDILAQGKAYRNEELVSTRNGKRIWCSFNVNPVFDAEGALTNTVCVMTEITHSKMHEVIQHRMLEAMAREDPLKTVMELVCHEIERVAPDVIASILRVDEQNLLRPLAAPSLSDDYSRAIDGLAIGPAAGSCGTAAFRGEVVIVNDIEQDPLWEGYRDLVRPLGLRSCWSTPIKSSKGRALGTLAFYYKEPRMPAIFHRQLVDVIVPICALALEREENRTHIRRLAFYDSLTGLPNRSLLYANAELALSEAQRNKTCLAVLFIDLDRFKTVNDAYGHPAGDELLQCIARRLSLQCKHNDIVGRLSGDEFVIILPQCDGGQATEIAEQIRMGLGKPCMIANTTLLPSASIGISLFPQDGHDIGTLINRADIAMYQAKSVGRSRFSFFCHELNQRALERQAMESALREALFNNQLHLHYQPQMCMRQNGKLHGIEALARWHHPQFGHVSPAVFVPLAEECGLIDLFSRWVIQESCRQLAVWRQRHLDIPTMAINLSATNFRDTSLPQMIMQTLERYDLQPTDLTLELTEGVLMDANPDTMATVRELHANGVRLSLDDFGTGYSSLSYLRDLPIQELKLDRSFVHDLETNATSRALSEAIIRIGESLQLSVVAEGIEGAEQYDILLKQGYHVAQGYLFSCPLVASDLEIWLIERTFQPIEHC